MTKATANYISYKSGLAERFFRSRLVQLVLYGPWWLHSCVLGLSPISLVDWHTCSLFLYTVSYPIAQGFPHVDEMVIRNKRLHTLMQYVLFKPLITTHLIMIYCSKQAIWPTPDSRCEEVDFNFWRKKLQKEIIGIKNI